MCNQTPLDKIKAYYSIKDYLTTEEQNLIRNMLKIKQEDLDRQKGLDAEIEFIIITYLLDACKKLTGFDEKVSQLLKTASSDLFVELKSGEKLLIEIKDTNKESWKISPKRFEEQQAFAKLLDADLYFAIRIKGIWGLYSSDYINNQGRKISLNDYKYSKLNNLLANKTYSIPDNIKILQTFSQNKKELDTKCNDGYLTNFEIQYNQKTIFSSDGAIFEDMIKIFYSEFLCDNAEFISKNENSNNEIIEEKVLNRNIIELYHLLITPIKHLFEENMGVSYNYNHFFNEVIKKKEELKLDKNDCVNFINELTKNGIPFIEKKFL